MVDVIGDGGLDLVTLTPGHGAGYLPVLLGTRGQSSTRLQGSVPEPLDPAASHPRDVGDGRVIRCPEDHFVEGRIRLHPRLGISLLGGIDHVLSQLFECTGIIGGHGVGCTGEHVGIEQDQQIARIVEFLSSQQRDREPVVVSAPDQPLGLQPTQGFSDGSATHSDFLRESVFRQLRIRRQLEGRDGRHEPRIGVIAERSGFVLFDSHRDTRDPRATSLDRRTHACGLSPERSSTP